jgi:hypothetical protein
MPSRIVDRSARSEVLRAEPFNAHFWACTASEFRAYLGRPREFLRKLGIVVPRECRIETTIENHDWLEDEAPDFENDSVSKNDTVICNLGCGGANRSVYRVVSYARDEAATGNVEKSLLHGIGRQQVVQDRQSQRGKKKSGKVKSERKSKDRRKDDSE